MGKRSHYPAKISDAERARAAREAAIVTAEGPDRAYRLVNGLGVEYRVTATSAIKAAAAFAAQHRLPGVRAASLKVLENGIWVSVL